MECSHFLTDYDYGWVENFRSPIFLFSHFSRILVFIPSGPRIQQEEQERRGKNLLSYLFCGHKLYRIENYLNYFIFVQVQKEIWDNWQRKLWYFLPQKSVSNLLKTWVGNPGSKIRDPEKTHSVSRILDPWVKKVPDPGFGNRIFLTIESLRFNPFMSTLKFLAISSFNNWLFKIVSKLASLNFNYLFNLYMLAPHF